MKLSKDLVPVKLINFVFQAGLACYMPYKSLFQKQLGLSPAQNGMIQSVEKIVFLLSPPVVGAIADKLSSHKLVLVLSLLAAIAFIIPMYFVPSVPIISNKIANCCWSAFRVICEDSICVNCSCDAKYLNDSKINCWSQDSNSTQLVCDMHFNESNQDFASSFACNGTTVACHSVSGTNQLEIFGVTFALMMVLTIFYACFLSPVQPLIDAATMNMLGAKRIHLYGQQRLWGSAGFGTVAFVTGILVDVVSPNLQTSEKNYLSSFVGSGVFGCMTAAICYWMKLPDTKAKSILSGARTVLCNHRIILFLFVILFSGYAIGVKYAFVYWYAESLPGSSQWIIGLSVFLACFSEIPVFFVSGWVCAKIGLDAVLSLGLLVAALRCYLYTFMTEAWQLLLIEPLHGLSFAFPMAAMCAKTSVLAPEGMTATLMGLTQGVYWGLGNMLGALIGGILYNSFSASFLFKSTAVVSAVVAVLYYVCHFLVIRYSSATNNPTDNQERQTKKDYGNEQSVAIPLVEKRAAV